MTHDNTVHTEKVGNLTIRIEYDMDPQSPDTWGDDGLFLVGYHRDFTVYRDKVVTEDQCRALLSGDYEDVDKNTIKELKKIYHIFPLEAYIHSGVALYLANECQVDRAWDVSLLGAVFVSRQEWKTREKAEKAARGLIETWNDCLSGNVYGYVVGDERGEHLDSCYGFIRDYNTEGGCLDEARAIAKHYNTPEAIAERAAKYKAEDIAEAKRLLAKHGIDTPCV